MPQSKADLLAVAHQRLYPSLRNSSYLVLRNRRLIFLKWIERLSRDLVVLDFGGRYQPYRPLLENRCRHYIAFDLESTATTDVVGQGEMLPFRAQSFDLVIATQVLEYLKDPRLAVAQIHETLKPGGILLASVASVAPRFNEAEHWRFLHAGLRSVLSPFASIEIEPEVYLLGGLCRTLNVGIEMMAQSSALRKVYSFTGAPFLNLLGSALEAMRLTQNDRMTSNYSVFARKAD